MLSLLFYAFFVYQIYFVTTISSVYFIISCDTILTKNTRWF